MSSLRDRHAGKVAYATITEFLPLIALILLVIYTVTHPPSWWLIGYFTLSLAHTLMGRS